MCAISLFIPLLFASYNTSLGFKEEIYIGQLLQLIIPLIMESWILENADTMYILYS